MAIFPHSWSKNHRHPIPAHIIAITTVTITIIATIAITSWLAPSLVAYSWADYIPLLSVILMYTGTSRHTIYWNKKSQNFVVRIWPWLWAHCVHAPRWEVVLTHPLDRV